MQEPGKYTKFEIESQPEVWAKSITRLLEMQQQEIPNLKDYQRILCTGCGSTYYLSLWAAFEIQKATKIPTQAVPAGELILNPSVYFHNKQHTLLIAISRSAETTETIRALEKYQASGIGDDVVITCYPERLLGQMSRFCIGVPDAREQSVAQTRSFSSMLLGISHLLNLPQKDTLSNLTKIGRQLLSINHDLIQEITANERITQYIFLGSGSLYGLACEAMLKMKEMSLAESQAFHFLEFRHGPISTVGNHSLVIALADNTEFETKLKVLKDIKRLGGQILLITSNDLREPPEFIHHVISLNLPSDSPWYAPCYLLPLQLLAFYKALANGQDPDMPKNLTAVVKEI